MMHATSHQKDTPDEHTSAYGNSRPLLRVKTTRPRIRPDVIERPALVARLNNGLARRLTLVSAPGGYGKTTAVIQWLDTLDQPSGWLSLDALDNDLTTFVAYLLAAARAAYPGTGTLTEPLLSANQDVPPGAFADVLIEDLATLDGSLVLVLDDFHLIHDSGVIELMERLLQFIPANVHLVLISRADPPLPLARLRLRGELAELRTDDLRFSPETAGRLLTTLTGVPFDHAAAATLDARTEGWALALQLAGLTMRDGESPTGLSERFGRAVNEHVASYLMEEVFARHPAPVRDFMLRTSLLERFSAPLCEALGTPTTADAVPSAAEMLTRLLQTNQMIVPLDDSRHWFRYHHLFQEFLCSRLDETMSRADIAALHRRAAAWLGTQGQINEALGHAVAAGDLDMAVSLVEDNLPWVMGREDWSQINRWLERLPAAAQDHPSILVARGWLHIFHLRIPALLHTLDEAEQQLASVDLSPARRDSLETQITILRGITAYWQFDIKKTLALIEQSLPRLAPEMSYARGTASNYVGLSMHVNGQSAEALQFLQSAIDSQVKANDSVTVRVLVGIMMINADIVNIQASLQAASMLVAMGLRNKFWNSYGWGYYGLGYLHYKMNQLQQAEEDLRHLLDSPLQFSASSVYHAYLLMALTLQARGREAEADEIIRRGREFAISTSNMAILTSFAAAEQQLRLNRGQMVTPSPAPVPSFMEAILDIQLPRAVSTILTRAQCLIRINSPESLREAGACLAVLHEAAERTNAPRQLAGIMAVEAVAMAAQGDEAGALSMLRHSLSLVDAAQMTRTYIDCGPKLLPLLRRLAEHTDAPAATGPTLAACEAQWGSATGPAYAAARPGSSLGLTRRELEVLGLMSEHLSDKQIAARLIVTPASVRQYATRIYAKLGVGNRRAATAAAEHLGLLRRD